MSAARKRGRFGYLSQQEASPAAPTDEERREETEGPDADESGGGEGGVSAPAPEPPTVGSSVSPRPRSGDWSVPKGQGRMKQERSQLNVRVPTSLKRQASAKAILEGRDIGEVVEELLREYLER